MKKSPDAASGGIPSSQIMLLTKVKETIKKYSMLNPGDRVLVAVSGGPDSVCLLGVLRVLAKDLDLTLHVAHLDHLFRGKESADEAVFVAELAKTFNIPATIEKFDVPAYCRERGLSSQEGARKVRYDFLQRTAMMSDSAHIATGHTANDQAETFLMRLIRGAGASGLSAIPPVRDNIIRPLIDITREEVLDYLKRTGLAFATDPSNTKPLYTRNRIRMEVLPVLQRFNPRIVATLAAEAGQLRDEDEAVEGYCATLADSILARKENTVFVKRNEFNTLPPAFRRRLLIKAADLAGVESSGLSRIQIDEAITFMAAARTGRTMNLLAGLTIGREYDRFVISAQSGTDDFSRVILMPGVTVQSELRMEIETLVADRLPDEQEDLNYIWQALFDYDKIGPALMLRSRHPGDWFCPSGMGGKRKKIQDYFVDEKVPRRKRGLVPLLCSGEDILWVVGMRTDERFLAGADTKRILTITVRDRTVVG
ncbi:MAG: tRNA lysidine(34) synthetase TilS [Nitrospirae bacterium]|nr:tRNA lysidine(34) synthetase TilS [Nitrospirota bacterium]